MFDPVIDGELASGAFERQQSYFRDWVGVDPRSGEHSGFAPDAGRYHLYLSLACPWCHRTAIVRALARLADAVAVSYLAPFRDERGWRFTGESFEDGPGGVYRDALHGWEFISEAYRLSAPEFAARITVPVLWDSVGGRIVNNESSDIIRMFGAEDSLGGLGSGAELALYPPPLRGEIDAINERVYDTINNGVYKAGFARRQHAYEHAFAELFESFEWLEALLDARRYLLGEQITESDWRLFPTLVRFDEVYNLHFRCNRRRLVDYPNLWAYARELYQQPGVADTVAIADQAPLLHHPRRAQPEAHYPRWPGV